jgi:hypothetical protein
MIITYQLNMEALTEALGAQGNAQHFITELANNVREELNNDDE